MTAILAVFCTSLLVFSVFFRPLFVSSSSSMFLSLAERALSGEVPYVDFFDPNPPLIIYLSAIPVKLAKFSSLHVHDVFNLIVLSLVIIFSFLLYRVTQHWQNLNNHSRGTMVVSIILFSIYVTVMGGFGQREHLFFCSLIPYLCLRWSRYYEKTSLSFIEATILGFLCGIFALLKPQFLFCIIVLEIILILHTRKNKTPKSPETIALFICTFLYISFLALMPEPMWSGFWKDNLPLTLQKHSVFNVAWAEYLIRYWHVVLSFIFFLIVAVINEKNKLTYYTSVLGVMIGLSLFWFRQGLHYHFYPLYGLFFFYFAIGFHDVLQNKKNNIPIKNVTLLIITTLTLPLIVFHISQIYSSSLKHFSPITDSEKILFRNFIFDNSRKGDEILVLSIRPNSSYPRLAMFNRTAIGSYPALLPVVYFNRNRLRPGEEFTYISEEKMDKREQIFIERLGKDIIQKAPPLVFIAEEGEGGPFGEIYLPGFSLYKYLANTQVYKALQERYVEQRISDVYVSFIRKN